MGREKEIERKDELGKGQKREKRESIGKRMKRHEKGERGGAVVNNLASYIFG
jgi:hypothetical protein